MHGMADLTDRLNESVRVAGIDLVGVTSAEPLQVPGGVYRHAQPREVLADARAVVVAGFCVAYEPKLIPAEPGRPRGRFTPYGSRAFLQMEGHCRQVIAGFLQEHGYKAVAAPRLPIKPAAVRAGLGRYGKHGVVIVPALGSWVMFACVVTDAPLACEEAPLFTSDCPDGCDLCRRACPTGAIVAPFQVDRARCITDWLWGAFAPAELREKQDTRLFGCGECLLACPRNTRIKPRRDYPVPIDEKSDSPELIPLLKADRDAFLRTIPSFAMEAGIEAIRGNAVIALGNLGDPAAVEALGCTLRHGSGQIRAYSAWALGRIGGAEAKVLLEAARTAEGEKRVSREIENALSGRHRF